LNTKIVRYLAGVLLALPVLLYSAGQFDSRILRELEYKLYDARLRFTAPRGIDPRIVIIDIDEKSLAQFGQWPWKRDLLATLIDDLFEQYDVEVLGLDAVFAEPDRDPALDRLKQVVTSADLATNPALKELALSPSRDSVLAASVNKHNVILGFAFDKNVDQPNAGVLPAPVFSNESGLLEKTHAPEALRFTGNLGELQSDRSAGFISLFDGVDSDGVIRRVPLLNKYKSGLYPNFSLAVTRQYLGTELKPVIAEVSDVARSADYASFEGLDMGFHTVSIDQSAAVYVPFRREAGSFRYISATDVVNNEVKNPEDLTGVIALLGTTAVGLVDNRATPIGPVFPGVEIHANLIASLMDGEFKIHPGWAKGAERLLLAIVCLLLVFVLPQLSALSMTLFSIGTLIAYCAWNLVLWQKYNFILSLAPMLVMVGSIYIVNIIAGYLLETRSRLSLKRSFGLYVPPGIIDSMQGQSIESLLRSEKKTMTVLFTDVRDFTTISEKMDPQSLSDLINGFLTPMTAIVHQHGGAIDKYMGDAMMAFWGAPVDDPEHASNAVHAAMAMVGQLDALNEEFKKRQWPQLQIGVGLNSGPMNVGNMGSAFRMAYTVLGDSVNLGSRLEGLTKQYGVAIIVSENTANLCGDIDFLELDKVRVKGKNAPVTILTPLGFKNSEKAASHPFSGFSAALCAYRQQNWDQASLLLKNLLERHPASNTALCQTYLERITYFRQVPPPQHWDGVFDFKTK